MPNSFTQDEVGPITRSVADAARLLDVMAGHDPDDPITAFGVGRRPASDAAALDAHALNGARIGVMTNLFGTEPRHAQVNAVMELVIRNMRARGATLIRFALPEYEALAPVVATDRMEAAAATDRYLKSLDPQAAVGSFRQLVESRTAHPQIQQALEAELAVEGAMDTREYRDRMLNRDRLRLAVVSRMATLELDAILYPLQRVLVAPAGESEQPERNGTLSNGTGLPAVCFPAGFTAPTRTAPLGIPVGAELLGRDYSERLLLSLAFAYEQAFRPRMPPASTPALA